MISQRYVFFKGLSIPYPLINVNFRPICPDYLLIECESTPRVAVPINTVFKFTTSIMCITNL